MSLSMLKNSPALERFKSKGIDVLVLNEEIDTIVFPMVTEYNDYKFVNVSDAKLEESEEEKKEHEEKAKGMESFVGQLQNALGENVSKVETTFDLTDSAVCLRVDKEDQGYMMAQMMKQFGNMGGDFPAPKPILQINPNHELIKKLS